MLASLLALALAAPPEIAIVAPDAPLEIEVGQTVLVEVKSRVARPDVVAIPPVQSVVIRPLAPRAGREAELLPWIEVVKVSRRFVTARVPLVGLRPGATTATLGLEIRERGAVDPVAVQPVAVKVRVTEAQTSAEAIDAWRALFEREDASAREAHGALRRTRVDVERLTPYPAKEVPEAELAPLARFYRHRLRATAARRALRAAADVADPELAKKATLALGAIAPLPGDDYDVSVVKRLANEKAIDATAIAIDDLKIRQAHAYADFLLASGRLDLNELARVLALRGFVMLARGDDKRAERDLGRAYCIRADLAPKVKRPMFLEAAKAARTANSCDAPLAVDRVLATRVVKDDRPALEVVATFGPDPHRLVAKANIQLCNYEGALDTSLEVPAIHVGAPRVEARLYGSDQSGDGYALLKVFLLDANGTELAAAGDPDPLAVPVVAGEGTGGPIPWWVWAVAGGVVVAGAATVGVVALARSGDVDRVIGPVDIRF